MKSSKPPLGLKPRFIWLEQRLDEISEAITRYVEAKMEIPVSWINERNELIKTLISEQLQQKKIEL